MPSRITETKGHLDAVKAMGYLRQKGVSATLAFAGRIESDDLVKKINELITMEGLDGKVIFLGELSAEKLRDWYGASDLVLIVSYSEGLARVILEAQAMRKPVVAYDVGGISEAIRKDQTGYLVRKGDIKGVAMKSKELLEDGGKRIIMGGHGRKYILSQFTIEHLVERHEAFYLNALNNCRG
jgi:glycosyltransferase involved in cell wall biosynthesis